MSAGDLIDKAQYVALETLDKVARTEERHAWWIRPASVATVGGIAAVAATALGIALYQSMSQRDGRP